MADRDYIYFDHTLSLCPHCLERIPAKIIFQGDRVYMRKACRQHGSMDILISDDREYYLQARHTLKAGQVPQRFNTETLHGCPHDCGICPDHEQHACVSILEITDSCNLSCPICYADSSPKRQTCLNMEEVHTMLDGIVANEGKPDVVQLSGGEPTLHPNFFEIIEELKRRPVKHLMVNTNGIRIAQDAEFARRIQSYSPGVEIYLQFDSLNGDVIRKIRGADLLTQKLKALEILNKLNLSTTLVVTVVKGLNDSEIPDLLNFALQQQAVRGVTFQPLQGAGRLGGYEGESSLIPLSEIRSTIARTSGLFTKADLLPVPCNPDLICMGYALKTPRGPVPLSQLIDVSRLMNSAANTIVFEQQNEIRNAILELFSTGLPAEKSGEAIQTLLCCLPEFKNFPLSYDNVFRVIILQFLDPWIFDVRSVKRSCVHIATRDGRMIPFDTMNIFYRGKYLNKEEAKVP